MNELVLAIDSSSVEAVINGKRSLVKRIPVHEKISTAHLEHTMISTLTNVLQSVVREHHSIHKIDIVLSTPWIVSKTKTSHFTYAKPLMIDRDYLDRMVQEERNVFKKLFPFDIEFVEQKVFEIKINGYTARLKKPVPAISLSISSAMSAMSKNILEKIHAVIEHFIHGVKISFHSSSILAYLSVRHLQPEIDSGLFVHIHGECTDITVFRAGIPTHFASINYGVYSLVHEIAHSLNSSLGVAESKISLFENEELHNQAEEKVTPLIEQKLESWAHSIQELLEQLESVSPRNVIIYSDTYATLFSNTIANTFEEADITNIPDTMGTLYKTGIESVEFHG